MEIFEKKMLIVGSDCKVGGIYEVLKVFKVILY